MRNELRYKIEVEPIMHAVLDQVIKDAATIGIEPDEVHRAVWSWVSEHINVEQLTDVNGLE